MGRKNKKKRILLWACGALLLGSVALFIGGSYAIRYRAMHRREEGIAASRAGEHAKAAELLARYLHRYPRDRYPQNIDALTCYVTSREKAELPNGQHFAETINGLRTLVSLDPDRLDNHRHLLELYAKLGRGPEALDTANAILKQQELKKQPPDERTLELKTDVLRRLRRDREALEVANLWTATAPQSLKGQMARLSLHASLKASNESIVADARKLLDAHPDDAQFQLLMGFAYATTNDDRQAAEWLAKAEHHPALSDEFVTILVQQFDAIGQSAHSIEVLKRHAAEGGGVELRHALGRRYWEGGKWRETLDALPDVRAEDAAADVTLLALKAIAAANAGGPSEAKPYRAAIDGRKTPTAAAWSMLLKRVIDGEALPDPAVVAACRAALVNDVQNPYLLYYFAEANARLGELDIAISALRQVAFADPTWPLPSVRLVDALLQKGRPELALLIAQNNVRRSPNSAAAVITMAKAWSVGIDAGVAGDEDRLLSLVTEVQKQVPSDTETRLIQAELLARRGKRSDAAQIIRDALSAKPPAPEPVFLAMAALSRRHELGLDAECYAACERAHGVTASLALARAAAKYASTHQSEDGLRAFDELASKAPKGAEGGNWPLARARYLDLVGDPRAKAAWIALRDSSPNDPAALQAVLAGRTVQGDRQVLQPAIDRLHALTDDRAVSWRLAQAKLMLDAPQNEEDYQKASVELRRLIDEGGDAAHLVAPRVLLAKALVHMNRAEGAVEQLSLASQADPTNVAIALQLATLLQSRGDFDRVEQELDRVTPFVHSAAQRQELAEVADSLGHADVAQRALEGKPEDAVKVRQERTRRGQLALASIYRRKHDYARAHAIVEPLLSEPDLQSVQLAASIYAAEKQPGEPERTLKLLDTLKLEPGVKELAIGSVYAQNADVRAAIPWYEKAAQAAPKNPVAWRALFTAQMAVGGGTPAQATLDRAYQSASGDPGFAALRGQEALVRQAIVNPELNSAVLAVIRDPAVAPKAFELMKDVVDAATSLDRARLASQLQALTAQAPTFLPAQVALVRCYAAMGRATESLDAAKRAMASFPQDPEPARLAALMAEASGRWDDLLSAASAWRQRSPEEAPDADVAIARAKLEQGGYEEAIALLRPYLDAAKASPDAHRALMGTYAMALLKADRRDEAGRLLAPLAKSGQPWRTLWLQVALQANLPKATAAAWLDQLMSLGNAVDPQTRVGLAEAFDRLASPDGDADLLAKSNALFGNLVKDPAVTDVALLAAATHAERAGDATAAEDLYRKALAKNAHLPVAANNLAMLVLKRGGNPTEAARLASSAVEMVPQSATLRDTLSRAQFSSGDRAAAVESMRQAVRLEPNNAYWQLRLTEYLARSGDVAEAARILQKLDESSGFDREATNEVREELKVVRTLVKPNRAG